MKHQKEFYGGRIKNLTETIAGIIARDPEIAKDLPRLHATLAMNLEGYGKRDKCYNCSRSMKISVYRADILDALLIIAMAKQVKSNMLEGKTFTEANSIHIPTLEATQATQKRFTKCDYLGLIKQPEQWRGSGYWLLTGWAWKALKGESIPRSVKYWEGKLIGRGEETTTLAEMFNTHSDLVAKALAKRKAVRSDYRAEFKDYKQSDWSKFDGVITDHKVE
jgi:hypothetical protein